MHTTISSVLAFFVLSMGVYGQPSSQIRLLDRDDSMPIAGAFFQYGNQTGISDDDGVLTFQFTEQDTMKLSHVSYGAWIWTPEQTRKLIREQIYYRSAETLNLYPIDVIAVRDNQQPDDQLSIDFQERMQHDGAAILDQIPAFSSIRKGGNYGFDPVFRGFKYDQINIVMNGAQSATAACPNRMDPPTSQMAPNMMARVEVLKGPHALRYGTGFGATVNFIPSNLRFTNRPDAYGRVSSGYENNGTVSRNEAQFGVSANKYDVSFFGSWSQGQDYQAGNGNDVESDFTRGSFGANVGVKLTSKQQLRFSSVYNIARDADFPALPMDLREDDTWMFNARHDVQLDRTYLSSWNTTVFGSFVDHKMDNLLKDLEPRMANNETLATTYNYGGRTEGKWLFKNSKLFAGADLRVEGAEGTRSRSFLMGPMAGRTVEDNAWQNGQISKTALFAEYSLPGKAFNYLVSVRTELNAADISDPSDGFVAANGETQTTQFNPSISLGIQKSVTPRFTAGLWLGRAQRSGSLTERYINFFPVGQDPFEMLGNPGLDPEVNNQVDVIMEWKSSQTALNVDLFASYLQDYISSLIDPTLSPVLNNSPGVRRYINIDDVFKTGFEVNWTQQFGFNLQHQLGIAYTYAQDLERNQALPEIPPLDLSYTLRGNYFGDTWTPSVTLRHVTEQSRVSEEFGENATPSFTLVDVEMEYRVTTSLRFIAGVNNLLDEAYFEHLNRSVRGTNAPIFAPGRNIFARFSFQF
ncbi:MAG: TonB-dependent receptor [Bacteroidota bacterium]